MPDWYQSFEQLKEREQEGTHYRISHQWRASHIAIVAPHGGSIEPVTSEVAAAIAGDELNLYCFEGLLPRSEPHERLHITSSKFDEPACVHLVSRSEHVVTVHGMKELTERIVIGGLDDALKHAAYEELRASGYQSEIIASGRYSALSPMNICNRGRRGRGIQLELARDLRVLLRSSPEELARFAQAVRRSLIGERQRNAGL